MHWKEDRRKPLQNSVRHPTPEVKAFSADVWRPTFWKKNSNWTACTKRSLRSSAKPSETRPFATVSLTAPRRAAIDGWEPFASYHRHCPHCLVRKIKVKRVGGDSEEVDQYYHRYVVAMLLVPVIDVVLEIEPVRNEEARRDSDGEHAGDEGELTAARRLIDSLHDTYGRSIEPLRVMLSTLMGR